MTANHCIDELDEELEVAYNLMENWLTKLGDEKWCPSVACKALVSKIKHEAGNPTMLLVAVDDILCQETEHIVQMSKCMAERCSSFAERSVDLIESGSILQVHSNLTAHISHHIVQMTKNLDRQQWLVMLLAELLEVDYPEASTRH